MKVKAYPEAMRDTLDYCMSLDDSIFVLGLGVNDSTGVFGTTKGLGQKYPDRFLEPSVAEEAFTGAAIGAAMMGMRPVVMFQRTEFALLAVNQIINHAAKIRYMSGGKQSCPVIFRIVVGKGWGNGAQHSQSLQSIFAHIPGLRVVMPSNPVTGQDLLYEALHVQDPTVIIEHRDIFTLSAEVAEEPTHKKIGPIKVQTGTKKTIVAVSAMVQVAKERYLDADIFDLLVLAPQPDFSEIKESYKSTQELVVMDTGWKQYGVLDRIVSEVKGDDAVTVGLPTSPAPSSVSLEKAYFQAYDPEFKGPF